MQNRRKILAPRWRKVLADLWEGKTTTLLVVASIAVGVFAIGTIATSYLILNQDLAISYAANQPANIELATSNLDDSFLHSLGHLPGVAQVEGRRVLSVRASKNGIEWQSLNLYAAEDWSAIQIDQLKTVAGASVPGDHELLIGFDQMRDTGFRTGDQLKVQLPDGTIRSLRVAGEAGDDSRGHDLMGGQRGYVTQKTMHWLGGSWDYNRLLARVSQNENQEDAIQDVADTIQEKIEKSGGTVSRSSVYRSSEFPMAAMLLASLGILAILGVLVALLSSSLIVNTLNALFVRHLRQIGVMKLIGGRRRQVLGMYLLMILGYALLALVVAAPLAAWAGYALAEMMAQMLNSSLQGFRVPPAVVAFEGMIAVLVPLTAGYLPVRNGAKISVQRALSSERTEDQPVQFGLLARLGVRLLSRPVLLSIRNTFRRKGRLLLTLFTLTMGGAIFIGVFNTNNSMDDYVDQLMQHFMADVTLTFNRSYRTERIVQAALEVPGVEKVEAWSGATAEILDSQDNLLDNMNIVAPPADTPLLSPQLLAGRWLRPGDQQVLVVSSAIYGLYPDLKPGDSLRLRVIASNKIEDWTVIGVFSFTEMLGGQMAYAEYHYMADLVGKPGQASSYRLITSTHDPESQLALAEAVDRHMRSLDLQVDDVEAGAVTRGLASQVINILIVFLLIMAVLTAFVGSIGLAGTMGMNVLERTREIGVMRAIGATDLEIVKSVVIEGQLIGLISWFFAVVVSYPISILMLRIITSAMSSDPIGLAFSPQGVLAWLGVALLLSTLASVLPARIATRLTIREVLAYE